MEDYKNIVRNMNENNILSEIFFLIDMVEMKLCGESSIPTIENKLDILLKETKSRNIKLEYKR